MSEEAANSAPVADARVFVNLPNFLTAMRIAAIPLLVWLLRGPGALTSALAFAVYLVASLTDFFDGYLARRYGMVTALGKLLDPLADKLLVVSALIMLAVMDRSPNIPGWLLVIVVGREIAVTGLRGIAANEGIVLAAETTGKIKMVLQTVAVHALILHYRHFGIDFHAMGILLLLAAAFFAVWSAVEYHVTVFRALRERQG